MPTKDIYQRSLSYHRFPKPGKLEVVPTKPLADQHDLALAYSPGVAAASTAIANDPSQAAELTARGNLIAVVSNGTAVLGLGDIGALAGKPVMEGKAVLFKKFAGVDVFDIEIDEKDPDKLIEIIASLEPTFGGLNLEDIKAPECFRIEKELSKRLKIPVFHDDQHGTAIIVAAAILNGLKLTGKKIEEVRLVTSGAGAAALACLELLVALGLNTQNIIICDSKGPVTKNRTEQMDEYKARYATSKDVSSLKGALAGADIFLGLSAAKVVTPDMIESMAPTPLVLALANPEPEIMPDLVRSVRPDAIIATGRSDFPNQVNNVLCFPYIFRGALDVGATCINQDMKLACVKAISDLAQAECSDIVRSAYGGEVHSFGTDYIIPKPFDPRLILEVAPVVAKAAMDSGVATRPIQDMPGYIAQLTSFIYKSNMLLRPVFEKAKADVKRVTFAEGEDERILQAVQVLLDEKIVKPILIGRPDVIKARIDKLGLRPDLIHEVEIINPSQDDRFTTYWKTYHSLMERDGISPDVAKMIVRTQTTIIGALTVYLGDSDALVCGAFGRFRVHLDFVKHIFKPQEAYQTPATLGCLLNSKGVLFIADPFVNENPTAQELCDITIMACEHIKRFGLQPKVALVSHSNFGTYPSKSALKLQEACRLLADFAPDLEVEGEMHADAALDEEIRNKIFPNSTLKGSANLLIMPNIESANIAFNLAKSLSGGLSVGPILMGLCKPVHILTSSTTVRGIVNMAAFAAVQAQDHKK
ncbi:MAG TPA: NADP-dependent malic enzyme [Alphaproteobacteria bacterium]|nr:NADP-dependent malic enzyme [Alphaproteobacteria bacterium]